VSAQPAAEQIWDADFAGALGGEQATVVLDLAAVRRLRLALQRYERRHNRRS
jgi:hypothetical protein